MQQFKSYLNYIKIQFFVCLGFSGVLSRERLVTKKIDLIGLQNLREGKSSLIEFDKNVSFLAESSPEVQKGAISAKFR